MIHPLPVFYSEQEGEVNALLTLDEEASRHISQVLRKQNGDFLQLTNGLGMLRTAEIKESHKKKTVVFINSVSQQPEPAGRGCIAVSLLKNTSRFEWFLEKVTEMGIREIIPLICERTEKQHFRFDRMRNILVSAMIQSQQTWLPILHKPTALQAMLSDEDTANRYSEKYVAHCMEGNKLSLREISNEKGKSRIVLIGPEGDFSPAELLLAESKNFKPVSMGDTRLRTETAAITAAALISVS